MEYNEQVVVTTLTRLNIIDGEHEYEALSKKFKKELEGKVFFMHDLRRQILSLRQGNVLLKSQIQQNRQRKGVVAKWIVARRAKSKASVRER